MKSKPVSHKAENTFKFETFNERLNKINVSTIGHLKRRLDGDDEDEDLSFFAIALEKWHDLNCTNDYKEFRKKIGSSLDVRNLVQIIHRKNLIAQVLIDELKKEDSKALNAVLDLIVALARDLQSDFYEFFPVIFQSTVNLVCINEDTDILEALFVCQTFLFKYLWKFILKDVDQHFETLKPALKSKKDYVLSFSSEVFSFLLRKSKQPEVIFVLIFRSLQDDPLLSKGIGCIMFESVKGVSHCFNSKGKSFFEIIFGQYLDTHDLYMDSSMEHFLNYLFEYCSTDSFKLLWNYLIVEPKKYVAECIQKTTQNILQVVEFKRCKFVNDGELVLKHCIQCLLDHGTDLQVPKNVLKIIEVLFNNHPNQLSDETLQLFCTTLFNLDSPMFRVNSVFSFAKKVLQSPLYEKYFDKYCYDLCFTLLRRDKEANLELCLNFLTTLIVSKRSRPLYGNNIFQFSKYPVNFESEFIVEELTKIVQESSDFKLLWQALVVLPHLTPILDPEKLWDFISRDRIPKFIQFLTSRQRNYEPLHGHVLLEAINATVLLKFHQTPLMIDFQQFIDLFSNGYVDCIELLRSLDLCLTYNKKLDKDFSKQMLNYLPELYPFLEENFQSSSRLNRIVSLHIMTLFPLTLPEDNEQSIFDICLEAELVPVELNQYRERLKHIRKLNCNFVSDHVPNTVKNVSFEMAPVHLLLGTLYENLSLLWKPILEVLETYSRLAKDKKAFIDIVFEHFRKTTLLIIPQPDLEFDSVEEFAHFKTDNIFQNSTADHQNHRVLLLKSFEMFPNLVEQRNREFVNAFFLFIESSAAKSYLGFEVIKSDNIKKDSVNQFSDDKTEDFIGGKMIWKTFFAYMEVFSKFKNPKAFYRESELHELYLKMLQSPNPSVQKHALDCLFTYNYDYLNKYKENFTNLVGEKTFASEIHSFNVHDNHEDNIIIEEDRKNVIPFFMRIIYGKMLASSGTKVHGKSKIDFRRSIILKVISSFNEHELFSFMELIFEPFRDFISPEKPETCYQFYEEGNDILGEINLYLHDLEFPFTFKQFLSLITTLEYLMKHIGNKYECLTGRMFTYLNICSYICSELLSPEYRHKIKEHLIQPLKTFRTNCYKVANYFFAQFDRYKYSKQDLNLLFRTLIDPLVDNLSEDSLDSPSPLLKLFGTWSENSRYYVLFAKQLYRNDDFTPIEAIMDLYSHPKVSAITVAYITTIIENLLSTENFDWSDNIDIDIEINNFGRPLCQSDYSAKDGKGVHFGSFLLNPYIKEVLERIKANYASNVTSNSKFVFTLQEINVLARLSLLVKDPSDSKTLSTLLLHSISQNRRLEEDKEVFTLKTLNHLANNLLVDDFFEILHLMTPLFSVIDKPTSRKELATFLCTLSKLNARFANMAQMVSDINAYDPRLPEEPNYDLRITAFKEIFAHFESSQELNQLQLCFIQLLLQNCSYFINNYDDLSLKDLSSSVIIKICHLFQDTNVELFNRIILNQIFYKIISRGFRQPKESVRHEYVNILVSASKLFAGKHSVIDQLLNLCNEKDEVDFWQNIKHIQIHRRSRTLNRLCNDPTLLSSLSGKVYTSFLIPYINNFIIDEHYAKNVSLLNASTDALATFVQYCSWYKYDNTLSYYVNGLLNGKVDSKIAIKTISALLEKFSFLKPDDVLIIEADLNAADFKSISLEYNTSKPSKPKQGKKKGGKKSKQKQETEVEAKVEDKENVEQNIEQNVPEDVEMQDEGKNESGENLVYKRKIYDSLCKRLLPLLHKCLHQRSSVEHQSDSHVEEFPEDDEIKRIPIALAIVKLLKHVQLNHHLFEANLNSIFLRLCQFLQSRAESIREAARGTLTQILKTLGPKYFKKIFFEMKSLFTRGYQRHVFIYTVYILLNNLTDQLAGGDLDDCLEQVIDVCHLELFGNLSEEKEVSHIFTKTKEAKKLKSYDIYEILAQFVSERSLRNMLKPLMQVMQETSSHKMMAKIKKAFEKIGRGLVANRHICVADLMKVIVETLESTLPQAEDGNEVAKLKPITQKVPTKVDYLLIPTKSLRRVTQTSKINRSSNSYVLSEFALTCYLYLLKNNRLANSDHSHKEILEPTLTYLESFLHSKDVQVITLAMKCLHILLVRFSDLSTFPQITQKIISRVFVLLNKYSGINEENTQLITLCFKTIGYFVNTRMDCKLSNEEIAILISYAEKDIENNSQNSTIYFMLKSIISRKFTSKELHVLMEKLLVMAITSEIDVVRNHAIELSIKYLSEYPIEKDRFKGKIVKLVKQLEYSTLSGRMAAILILKNVINFLNYQTMEPLKRHLFLPLSLRLYNEESPECKKLIADTIVKILSKLSPEDRDLLYISFVNPWISSDEISIQIIASMVCSLFVNYEKKNFEPRLESCLPLISQQLDPTRFKSITEIDEDDEFRDEDMLIFQHLTFVLNALKLEGSVQLLTKVKYNDYFNEIVSNVITSYLLHSHSWIRHLSTQIIGQIFSLFSPESFIHDQDLYKNFHFFQDSREKCFVLCKNLCLVFRDLYNCVEMSEQLVKNLIYLARVVVLFDDQKTAEQQKLTLEWVIKKVLYEINYEIKNQPDQYGKRLLAFKWISAVAVLLGKDRIEPYLDMLLQPLCRLDVTEREGEGEPADGSKADLINLNKQVLQLLRNLVGSDVFIDHYNAARNRLSHRRIERRKQRAIQMLTQMDVAVKRKLRKHKKVPAGVKRRKVTSFKVSKVD